MQTDSELVIWRSTRGRPGHDVVGNRRVNLEPAWGLVGVSPISHIDPIQPVPFVSLPPAITKPEVGLLFHGGILLSEQNPQASAISLRGSTYSPPKMPVGRRSVWRESNPQPHAPRARALPNCATHRKFRPRPGIEPPVVSPETAPAPPVQRASSGPKRPCGRRYQFFPPASGHSMAARVRCQYDYRQRNSTNRK